MKEGTDIGLIKLEIREIHRIVLCVLLINYRHLFLSFSFFSSLLLALAHDR